MDILFRKCTVEDLSDLCTFSRAVFYETFRDSCSPEDMESFLDHAYSTEKLRGELLNPDSSFFLLYQEGVFAGYIKLNESPAQTDIHDPDALELERIYVSRSFQGTGLGSCLMERAVEIAKQRGRKYLWLGVWEKNEKAISFYRKHGFHRIGTHTFRIGGDAQTDYVLRRDL